MISLLFILLLFITVDSTFPYPTYGSMTHHSKMDAILESAEARKDLPSNSVLACDMDDIMNTVTLDELQLLVEAIAVRKGIGSLFVLRKLIKKMMSKDLNEQNSFDGALLADFLNQPLVDYPPQIKFPSESSRAPYYLPPDVSMGNENEDDTNVVIIPVLPPAPKSIPGTWGELKPNKESNNVKPLPARITNLLSGFMSPVKNQLRPPHGATIRIDPADPLSPLNRDVSVTVSPLMNLIEALRQSEHKYRSILDLTHDIDVFTFAHSSSFDCYVIDGIYDVFQTENNGWKVTITDRDGQIKYDSFCLPNPRDTLVTPGSFISLTYAPL